MNHNNLYLVSTSHLNMGLVKLVPYETHASYEIEASTRVGEVDFSRTEEVSSPSEALKIVKTWQHPDIKLGLSRTIYFERRDGYLSKEPSIEESLTLEQLEQIVSKGENLPIREHYVSMSVEEARARMALIEAVTGRPAVWSVA